MVADEGETEGDIRDRAKRDNQGWSVASVRAKDTGSGEEVSETFMPVKKGSSNSSNTIVDKMKKAANIPGIGAKKPPVKEPADKDIEETRMKDKKSQEGNKFTGNLMKARAAGKKQADLDGDGDMEKVQKESQDTATKARAGRNAVANDLANQSAPKEGYSAKKARAGKDIDKSGKKQEKK